MGLKHLVKLKDFFSQKVVNRYFVFWAHWTIRRWRPRTIVITGSSGKTGLFNLTKEIRPKSLLFLIKPTVMLVWFAILLVCGRLLGVAGVGFGWLWWCLLSVFLQKELKNSTWLNLTLMSH